MIIICNKPGQLGNRLFVFAHFIAFSREHGIPVMNVSFDEYAVYFPFTSDDLLCRYPARTFPMKSTFLRKVIYFFFYYLARIVIRLNISSRFIRAKELGWEENADLESSDFRMLSSGTKILLLQGWRYRGMGYLKKHSGFLRELFVPAREHLSNVLQLIAGIKKDDVLLIGLHIRQGDYAKFEGGKYFYSIRQYAEVMRKIIGLFPGRRVRFLICSNVKIEDKELEHIDFAPGTGHLIEDMYAFSKCDFLAGPPSTYTMWASFYGNVPLFMIRDAHTEPELSEFKIIGI